MRMNSVPAPETPGSGELACSLLALDSGAGPKGCDVRAQAAALKTNTQALSRSDGAVMVRWIQDGYGDASVALALEARAGGGLAQPCMSLAVYGSTSREGPTMCTGKESAGVRGCGFGTWSNIQHLRPDQPL